MTEYRTPRCVRALKWLEAWAHRTAAKVLKVDDAMRHDWEDDTKAELRAVPGAPNRSRPKVHPVETSYWTRLIWHDGVQWCAPHKVVSFDAPDADAAIDRLFQMAGCTHEAST